MSEIQHSLEELYTDEPRVNPVASGKATVTLERGDKKFGFDYGEGPDIRYCKQGCKILDKTVDVWLVGGIGSAPFVFIGKL